MTPGFLRKLRRSRKGQALLEYGMTIAGVSLVSAAALSIFGHKTSDMIGAMASVLPGAQPQDNNPIQSGRLIETGPVGTNNTLTLDLGSIGSNKNTDRLGVNVVGSGQGAAPGFDNLIVETH
jgi:hypothetical protein